MKAGEYEGKDERTYRWEIINGEYTHTAYHEGWCTIAPADWPAAKAALDALIAEQDAEQWVELDEAHRISLDGARSQFRTRVKYGTEGPWKEDGSGGALATIYRMGLEVAHAEYDACDGCPGVRRMAEWHAEHEALREQVRALVEAVDAADAACLDDGERVVRAMIENRVRLSGEGRCRKP